MLTTTIKNKKYNIKFHDEGQGCDTCSDRPALLELYPEKKEEEPLYFCYTGLLREADSVSPKLQKAMLER